MILVGIKILVDRCVRLFNLGVCGRLEVHMQILGEVPAYGEVAVPKELLTESKRQT